MAGETQDGESVETQKQSAVRFGGLSDKTPPSD
jgi:hypothetical protein